MEISSKIKVFFSFQKIILVWRTLRWMFYCKVRENYYERSGKTWKSQGIYFSDLCRNPVILLPHVPCVNQPKISLTRLVIYQIDWPELYFLAVQNSNVLKNKSVKVWLLANHIYFLLIIIIEQNYFHENNFF